MDRYEINPAEARQGAEQLNHNIEELRAQLESIASNQEEFMNDSLWHGPSKTTFSTRFAEYKQALDQLLANAIEHHSKLLEIIATYENAEQ